MTFFTLKIDNFIFYYLLTHTTQRLTKVRCIGKMDQQAAQPDMSKQEQMINAENIGQCQFNIGDTKYLLRIAQPIIRAPEQFAGDGFVHLFVRFLNEHSDRFIKDFEIKIQLYKDVAKDYILHDGNEYKMEFIVSETEDGQRECGWFITYNDMMLQLEPVRLTPLIFQMV